MRPRECTKPPHQWQPAPLATKGRANIGFPCSYTKADNSVIVATDSIKNTIYITAKQQPVTTPEVFGSILGSHFVEKYSHIHAAHVKIVTHRWVRMNIDGKPHPHSFIKDSPETRNVQVDVVEGKGIDINSSINGLTVLKSTGSQFWGFLRDEFTTLKETWDRILSTDVSANWQWRRFNSVSEVKANGAKFDTTWEAARAITLKTFAEDNSASVQATMYKMGEQILATAPLLETVEYELPNNHYFEIGTFDPCFCFGDLLLTPHRSQLAQGNQEHRQGCRGVRSPVQPQRPYQMHSWPCWPQGQAVNASIAGLWSFLA